MSPTRRMAPVDEQLPVLLRGTEFGDDATRRTMERELRARLEEDRPLHVYCGYDPTSVDLTLGHTLTMRKLRQFQDFGHEVTFLIGNFTGLIGDPSDKDKLRPMLTPEQLARLPTEAIARGGSMRQERPSSGPALRRQMRERFDTNGDGTLDQQEIEKAKEEARKRRGGGRE